jgi:cytochrome oxidase assembly protein ShyY1
MNVREGRALGYQIGWYSIGVIVLAVIVVWVSVLFR